MPRRHLRGRGRVGPASDQPHPRSTCVPHRRRTALGIPHRVRGQHYKKGRTKKQQDSRVVGQQAQDS
ncbi:unnamed protein product [Bursaphelenchus okinawaensis]|uniref:Uncharacterized protein n=1 Tax=Bursaphelenchus okinawaensis TaxID=465554 RepID=A0A811L033_9BILA|nr:unnamed protein product [Bursaphelenchus okinawaensis]CAG9113778.1 unnamed protein product [Bursaphelenchus okinawaensis]